MRVGRNIIISAILALGASGSILASVAVPRGCRAGVRYTRTRPLPCRLLTALYHT